MPGVLLGGRYRLEAPIGSGAFGAVWRGRDETLHGRPCAIKAVLPSGTTSAEQAERLAWFRREAQILSQLRHPAICDIRDVVVDGGQPYLVLELIDGQSLSDVLAARGNPGLPEHDVVSWAQTLCDALSYLHSQAIIVRDIKPQNVMLRTDGRVTLIDFGIARPTSSTAGTAIGSPGYASPEQYQGVLDVRSDIYSLAATLHHLLTGRDPSKGKLFDFPRARSITPTLSVTIDAALERALQIVSAQRFSSAHEFATALTTPALNQAPVQTSFTTVISPNAAMPHFPSAPPCDLQYYAFDEDLEESKVDPRIKAVPGFGESEGENSDKLLVEATKIMREYRRASVSLLQRRLSIGYGRAARLLDQLEERGVVGPSEDGRSRVVLDLGPDGEHEGLIPEPLLPDEDYIDNALPFYTNDIPRFHPTNRFTAGRGNKFRELSDSRAPVLPKNNNSQASVVVSDKENFASSVHLDVRNLSRDAQVLFDRIDELVDARIAHPPIQGIGLQVSIRNVTHTTWALVWYDIDAAFHTSVGEIHREQAHKSFLLDAQDGHYVAPQGKTMQRGSVEALLNHAMTQGGFIEERSWGQVAGTSSVLPAHTLRSHARKVILDRHTRRVTYYGANRIAYEKTCVPSDKDLRLFRLILVPVALLDTNFVVGKQTFSAKWAALPDQVSPLVLLSADLPRRFPLCQQCGGADDRDRACVVCQQYVCASCAYRGDRDICSQVCYDRYRHNALLAAITSTDARRRVVQSGHLLETVVQHEDICVALTTGTAYFIGSTMEAVARSDAGRVFSQVRGVWLARRADIILSDGQAGRVLCSLKDPERAQALVDAVTAWASASHAGHP